MAKKILNNLETYGIIRNKINDNFTELYVNKSEINHSHNELHTHTNKDELDKIGEDISGNLTYNGLPIEGGSGTSDYKELSNKPSINDIELSENKTLADLGIQPSGDYLTEIPSEYVTDTELESKSYATTSQIPDVSNKLEISNILQGTNIILNKVGNDITINSTGEGGSGGSIVADSEINGNILIDGIETNVYEHPSGTNPHGTTKADVGLENVDNTSDLNKPISDATQTALNGKAESIHTHDYSKVEESLENGNIILNETETNVYTLPSDVAKTSDLHSHNNKTALDEITTVKTTEWDTVTNKLDKTGDTKDNTTTFSEAEEDVNIATNETHSTMFGKILKSIKTLRYNIGVLTSEKIDKANIVNNTVTTAEGTVLDGRMGKNLQDQVTTINNNLANRFRSEILSEGATSRQTLLKLETYSSYLVYVQKVRSTRPPRLYLISAFNIPDVSVSSLNTGGEITNLTINSAGNIVVETSDAIGRISIHVLSLGKF